jgi:transposase-like protein
VAGTWTYLYRALDQHGQVIDVLLSARRDLTTARRFFTRALRAGTVPVEVTTDRASVYPAGPGRTGPSALHTFEQYANNPVEADHGRLKARLRPMRGLKRHRSARILAAGHAFVQNLRRPLRHRYRSPQPPQAPRGIRQPRAHHLNPAEHPDHAPTLFREGTTQQCRHPGTPSPRPMCGGLS